MGGGVGGWRWCLLHGLWPWPPRVQASGKHACASFSISANSASSSLGYRSESFGISSFCSSALALVSSFCREGRGVAERGWTRGGHSGRHDLCGNQPVS